MLRAVGGSLTTSFFTAEQMLPCIINQSHCRPEMARGFQEVKVPTLCDNGPERCAKLSALRTGRLYPQKILLVIISVRG
jgi:hypothetical protein